MYRLSSCFDRNRGILLTVYPSGRKIQVPYSSILLVPREIMLGVGRTVRERNE